MLVHLLISSRGPDFLMLSKRVAASENEIEDICVVRDVITYANETVLFDKLV